jgi:lipoyl(octanoyl) transferase
MVSSLQSGSARRPGWELSLSEQDSEVAMDMLQIRQLGLQEYASVWQAMRDFTACRHKGSCDQLWLVEHSPVFTLGLNGKACHLGNTGDIPVVRCDRGGQVTYHGPGQVVAYVLLDLQRRDLGVRQLVEALELSVLDLLHCYSIVGERRPDAPGVYVQGKKIASLGLRVRRGHSYHGLSLNVAMDLAPFRRIDPCGYVGLEVVDLKSLGVALSVAAAGLMLARQLSRRLGYRVFPHDVQEKEEA